MKNNLKFTLLTKGGNRALRDFDLLTEYPKCSIGQTIVFSKQESVDYWEPNASPVSERFNIAKQAKALGIKTWISLEPVIDLEQAFEVACVIPFLLGDRYRAEGLGAANDEDYFTMRHLYLREPLPREFQHIDIERQAERLKKVGVLVETLNGGYKIGGGT